MLCLQPDITVLVGNFLPPLIPYMESIIWCVCGNYWMIWVSIFCLFLTTSCTQLWPPPSLPLTPYRWYTRFSCGRGSDRFAFFLLHHHGLVPSPFPTRQSRPPLHHHSGNSGGCSHSKVQCFCRRHIAEQLLCTISKYSLLHHCGSAE